MRLRYPVARRGRALGALGNLTLNGNAEVDRLSDFGTLTRVGAGANWSPLDRVNLIASWTDEENAPSVRQLGNPFLETPQMRIFDFTNRIVTRADILTGGNPALRVERQHTVKLSAMARQTLQVYSR